MKKSEQLVLKLKSGGKSRKVLISFKPLTDALVVDLVGKLEKMGVDVVFHGCNPESLTTMFAHMADLVKTSCDITYKKSWLKRGVAGDFVFECLPMGEKTAIIGEVKKKLYTYMGLSIG